MATRNFQAAWNTPYTLTNVDDPAQVEADFIGHYELVLEFAKKMFEVKRGYYPEQGVEDPCNTGDHSFENVWVWRSQRELETAKWKVIVAKSAPMYKWQIDGLGYLLQGTPWNEMPQWVRLSLMRHIDII